MMIKLYENNQNEIKKKKCGWERMRYLIYVYISCINISSMHILFGAFEVFLYSFLVN